MSHSGKPVLVVKTGGRVASDEALMKLLAVELNNAIESGRRVLLVHGGGTTISTLQNHFGIKPRFVDGLRQTDPIEMPLVDMALAGGVNKQLVRLFSAIGVRTWGISGADAGILQAESRSGVPETNRTGIVKAVDSSPLELIWNAGYLPICAPIASDRDGNGINVNADEAALALAAELNADHLIFISDVPGVLENGKPIAALNPDLIEEKIESGIITGGMIPKTRSAAAALGNGVGEVIISDYAEAGNLKEMLSGNQGTRIAAGGYLNG